MSRKNIVFWSVALAVVLLDQLTKYLIYTRVDRHESIEVIPHFFSIVHAQNPGAAMGILGNFEYRYVIFIGFTIVAVGIILNMQRQLADELRFLPTMLGLIFAGAIGNGIDRIHKRTVTDFLRFYTDKPGLEAQLRSWFGTAEYPSFNVADIALVVGVGLFVTHYLFLDEGELDGPKKTAAPPAEPKESPAAGDEPGKPSALVSDEDVA